MSELVFNCPMTWNPVTGDAEQHADDCECPQCAGLREIAANGVDDGDRWEDFDEDCDCAACVAARELDDDEEFEDDMITNQDQKERKTSYDPHDILETPELLPLSPFSEVQGRQINYGTYESGTHTHVGNAVGGKGQPLPEVTLNVEDSPVYQYFQRHGR